MHTQCRTLSTSVIRITMITDKKIIYNWRQYLSVIIVIIIIILRLSETYSQSKGKTQRSDTYICTVIMWKWYFILFLCFLLFIIHVHVCVTTYTQSHQARVYNSQYKKRSVQKTVLALITCEMGAGRNLMVENFQPARCCSNHYFNFT